jgi:pilus assembly protein CpaF
MRPEGRFVHHSAEAVIRAGAPLLPLSAARAAAGALTADPGGFGRIGALLAEDDVAEVMVNAGSVWIERGGRLEPLELRLDDVEVARLIERIVGPAGARVDRASPMVDVRLPDGSRANVVLPPLALDGPCITIRRFVLRHADLADFAGPDVCRLLADAVTARTNLVVSGGTGSGKTTLLNALAAHIPRTERIVTIEDTAELRLPHPHVVRLQARQPNSEGVGEVTIRSLVRTSLRMRPDRILVGEARGGEVMDVLQAMNTGHEGSMSTCHANSPVAALRRLEALALLGGPDLPAPFVRDQLTAALRLVVHVRRGPGRARRIDAVMRVGPRADWVTGRDLQSIVERGRLLAQGCAP